MSIKTPAVTLAAGVIFAAAAATAGATHSQFIVCKTPVKAAGFTFHVSEVGLPSCRVAEALTLQLAHKGISKSGPRPYAAPYLGMRCFSTARGKLAQIQCTGNNGKKTLYAVAKP